MSIADINRILEPWKRRILLMTGRATVEKTTDADETQRIQATVLAGEVVDDIERLPEYGFTSVPMPGASAIIIFAGGNRGNGAVIATDDARYRVHGLKPGEVAIYNNTGSKIVLREDGNIEITAPTVIVNGDIEATGDVKAGSISLKTHVHGGVNRGSGLTNEPS